MANGVVSERHAGTPPGGPWSPLVATVLRDAVDQELEEARPRGRARRRGRQRVRAILEGGRASAGRSAKAVWSSPVAHQRGEERGGARDHLGVAGDRVLAWSGRQTAPPSGRQGPGSDEEPRAGEHGAPPRAKRPSSRRGAESGPHRRASVFGHGRDAGGLPEPGGVETTPAEAEPPAALEDVHTSACGVPRPRSCGGTCQAGGGGCQRWWSHATPAAHVVLTKAYFDGLGVPRLAP